jgi:hypothetical protein
MSDVTPAVISGVVALVVAGAGIIATAWRQKNQLANDLSQAEKRLQGDLKVQEERLKTELRTEFMAEAAIRQLLSHPDWKQRTFQSIRRKMHGAFEDPELRRLLIRSGAVCFWGKLQGGREEEYWGLIDRNQDRLSRRD